MRRVIVTGATSMVGGALVRECVKHQVGVLAVVREGSARLGKLPKSSLVEAVECDLGSLGSLMPACGGEPYDVCYHFAWAHTAKGLRDDPLLQQENIKHTLDAVEMAARFGCRKFVGAGSQAEYGPQQCAIAPDTGVNPQVSYGIAKYAAGLLSRNLCRKHGMAHVWGRVFSVYGSNDREESMLSYAISQFMEGKAAKFSSASQAWDYLHEDDAGRVFYLLGECVEKESAYCIASGQPRPLKEFILELQEAFGKGAECVFAAEGSRPPDGLRADASSLFRDIPFQPAVDFKEGVKKMVDDRRKSARGGVKRGIRRCLPGGKRVAA